MNDSVSELLRLRSGNCDVRGEPHHIGPIIEQADEILSTSLTYNITPQIKVISCQIETGYSRKDIKFNRTPKTIIQTN